MRVEDVGGAVGRPVEDEVAIEGVQGAHLAGPDLARLGDDEPAVRDREGIAVGTERRGPIPAAHVGEQIGVPRHREPGRQPAVVHVRLGGRELPQRHIFGRVGHPHPPAPRSFRQRITNSGRASARLVQRARVPCSPWPARIRRVRVRPKVGRPPRISRQMIAEAANEIGLDGLTLRAVADHLDVTIAALYHHVSGKDDLMRAGGRVLGRDRPDPAGHGAALGGVAAGVGGLQPRHLPGPACPPRPVPRRGDPDGDHRRQRRPDPGTSSSARGSPSSTPTPPTRW